MVNVEDNFIISWIGRSYQMSVPKIYSVGAQGFCTVLQEGLKIEMIFIIALRCYLLF